MESETGPEEGGSTPGSWILVVSPGPHEGGALGPTGLVGAAEAMQAPSGAPGEEAALFWVEEVEEGAALEEGEVAGIGQEFQLLVLDVMEEVEVVVYEEQEQVSSEDQGQEHPRPRAPSDQPALEALVALQLELDPVNKKAQRAHARLKHKNCQRRRVHLEHRSAIIQGIPGFWVEVASHGACGSTGSWIVTMQVVMVVAVTPAMGVWEDERVRTSISGGNWLPAIVDGGALLRLKPIHEKTKQKVDGTQTDLQDRHATEFYVTIPGCHAKDFHMNENILTLYP
ncbi:hypothetical protein AB1E18_019640 [Capra hircus]